MRVAIIGSRDYPDRTHLDQAIAQSGYEITAVLCGGARGPDTWGKDWAEQRGIPVVDYPADWGRYGKRAGMIRNTEMIAAADAVIALWDGVSRGTAEAIKLARRRGIPVCVAIKANIGTSSCGWLVSYPSQPISTADRQLNLEI
jgi:hypothetical protein